MDSTAATTPDTADTSLTTIAIVPVDCKLYPGQLPGAGRPLFVTEPRDAINAPIYRGCRISALSPKSSDDDDDANRYFAGVVWIVQPLQVVAHRGIALVAVVTDGYAYLRATSHAPTPCPGEPVVVDGHTVGIALERGRVWVGLCR